MGASLSYVRPLPLANAASVVGPADGSCALPSSAVRAIDALRRHGQREPRRRYNIIEAVAQLRKTAAERQLPRARRALVYGNGGVFSHSAVAIMSDGIY